MITIIIIAITAIISFNAFKNRQLVNNFIFDPIAVTRGEYKRLFTYGLIHADLPHLIFNMFTLYFFGTEIERVCKLTLGETNGSICFIILYALALPISILPTYLREKNNEMYRGLGASGAVSAVVFAFILVNPLSFMGIMFIPIMLPAFIFGFIFVAISIYLDRKQSGNVNHLAHVWGGVFGIFFMIIYFQIFLHINLLARFVSSININSISDLIHFGY